MSEPGELAGVEQAHVIDLVTHDEASGVVTLVMAEPRAWSGEDWQLFQLQEKLNAYLSFALDGEMAETYPEHAGRPLKVRLDCYAPPDARTVAMLDTVRRQIAFRGIDLEVWVRRRDVPGTCGCGSEHGCA